MLYKIIRICGFYRGQFVQITTVIRDIGDIAAAEQFKQEFTGAIYKV